MECGTQFEGPKRRTRHLSMYCPCQEAKVANAFAQSCKVSLWLKTWASSEGGFPEKMLGCFHVIYPPPKLTLAPETQGL